MERLDDSTLNPYLPEHPKGVFGFGRNVFSAGVVSFFMDVSSEMVYPLVPLFLTSVLGANKALVGLIEGVAESTASLMRVFSGWLSDKLNRRKDLMLGGYGLSTLSRPITALANAWPQLLVGRFVDRLGKGIRTAPRDAIIAESTPKDHLARAFSFHRAMDTFGAVVGPALAFVLLRALKNDYRMVFWLSMIPGFIAVVVIVFFITEKKAAANGAFQKLSLRHFDWRAKYFFVVAFVFSFGNSSDAFVILKAKDVGVEVALIPIVYLVYNLVYSSSAIPAGIFADRFGKRLTILIGFLLFAAMYAGFARAKTPGLMWWLFGAYGLSMGFMEGIQKAYLATLTRPELKATTFGIYATAVGIATFPASLIAGWLWDRFSPAATFYFGTTTALLAALMFLVLLLMGPAHQRGA